MTETQITFKDYQKLQHALNIVVAEVDILRTKYYNQLITKDQHIKDLRSEVRFLRNRVRGIEDDEN